MDKETFDFDNFVKEANINPNTARKVLQLIVKQAIEELRYRGQSEIPNFGKIIVDYIKEEPIFYLFIKGKSAVFEPDQEFLDNFKKLY